MQNRTRTTWAAADRKASAPPAVPGYGKEDQDHPAHQPDPALEAYQKGDPSAWAEDVHQPPYPAGNPPANPGYDVEDQDHPAHTKSPRVPKEATLKQMLQRKASKCLRVARAVLGPQAKQAMVEDHALDLMDLPETCINAMYARHAGGFLADEEQGPVACGESPFLDLGFDDPMPAPVDEPVFDDGFFAEEEPQVAPAMQQMYAMMRQMQAKLDALASKKAEGEDEAEKVEDEAKKEAKKAEGDEPEAKKDEPEAKKEARRLFASLDRDRDGFITAEDWSNKSLFTAFDADGDGFLAEDEFVDAWGGPAAADEEFGYMAELDEDEIAMLRALQEDSTTACGVTASKKKGKKAEGEDEEVEAAKKAKGKKAAEEEPEAEDDESEDDESEDEGDEAEDDESEDESEDEGDEEADKEAAYFDDPMGLSDDPMGLSDDPMGLSGEPMNLTVEDEAVLASIFGDENVTASQVPIGKPVGASLKPKPKKAAQGVKTLGSVSRTASAKDSVESLSELWESAPDVSKVFGM